jgi:hypothetical protein
MCKASGESPDHFLLHCIFAKNLWSMVFFLFDISWVLPPRVVDLLASWIGRRAKRGGGGGGGVGKSCLEV